MSVLITEVKQSFGLAREAIEQWATARGVERADLMDPVEVRRGLIHGLITLTMAHRVAGARARQNPGCRRR